LLTRDVDVALEAVGERAHRREVGEVELADLGLAGDRGGGVTAAGLVADREHDARPGAAQLT
jgi:hypothetical protein